MAAGCVCDGGCDHGRVHLGAFLAVAAIEDSAADLLLLGLLFNAMGVCWLLFYAVAAARGRGFLVRPPVRRVLDRITGVMLIGLGTRLALEKR
jgi:threonine/homoserine/homoserine lactone efflux protein